MSQPEWMQKFKEIGQKSQRFDSSGNVIVESMDDKFKKIPPVANATVPSWMKKKEETKTGGTDDAASKPAVVVKTDDDDDDAAALFAGAASKAAVVQTDDEEEGAAAAAAPAASGGLTGEEEEMFTKYKKMLKMGMPEGAVAQKMLVDEVPQHIQDAVLAPPEEETVEEEIIEEEFIEESVVSSSAVEESVEESVHSESVAGATQSEKPNQAEAAASSSPASGDQKMSDEEFGDRWVVDKEQLINELSTTKFEEVEVDRDTGDVHYEEVYIDENGNEVVVQQGDPEMNEDEEEIFVDEDGNEVEYEEEEEVQDEEVLAATAQVREMKKEDEYDEPVEPPYDPDYDVENQLKLLNRRSKAYRSRMAPWVPYVFLFAFIAAAILILFFVILAEDDGLDPQNLPTAAPTPKNFLPLGPTNTGAIDVSATTPLEPVAGNCNFSRNSQPHVIDQCSCTGSISIIADDVRQRYDSLLETFMSSVISDFDEAIDSCDASNQALVWLSSGLNNAGEAQDFVRRERYALAYFYMDQGGVGWSDNSLWLSEVDVCQWDRVSCDQNGRVVSLDVSSNRIVGQVSAERRP
jgi:hypothetical protein